MIRSQFSTILNAAKQSSYLKQSLRLSQPSRFYASAGLSRDDIQSRIFDVLKSFDKVKAENVCLFICTY